MIRLKTAAEIDILRVGGRHLARILGEVAAAAQSGVSAKNLDELAREKIAAIGGQPSFLNYRPPGGGQARFPAALCVSINDVVVHGIPTADMILQDGDLVGLDLGLSYDNLFTDMAMTIEIGAPNSTNPLLAATRAALAEGIAAVKIGNHLGDIGRAVEDAARRGGYGLVRELGGHGVGYRVHEEPEVPNYGRPGAGEELKAGLVIAIEPMFNQGSGEVVFLPDGFTVKTKDGGRSAHFEHTVAITARGPEILTLVD